MKNHYNTLQLSKEADAHQIRQAFRQMSKRHHPDRNGGSRYHEEKFKEINEAYQVLKDPVRRWEHKQGLERQSFRPRSRPCGDWATPDYTAEYGARRKRKAYRPKSSYSKQKMHANSEGAGSTFWSCVLFLVILAPFFMAGKSGTEKGQSELMRFEQTVSYESNGVLDLKKTLDERYQRDINFLNKILKTDPDLRELDLETGYYETNGRSIRLSWDVLQLIREKHWKRQ